MLVILAFAIIYIVRYSEFRTNVFRYANKKRGAWYSGVAGFSLRILSAHPKACLPVGRGATPVNKRRAPDPFSEIRGRPKIPPLRIEISYYFVSSSKVTVSQRQNPSTDLILTRSLGE